MKRASKRGVVHTCAAALVVALLLGTGCNTGTDLPIDNNVNLTAEQAKALASANVENNVGGAAAVLGAIALDAQLLTALGGVLGEGTTLPEDSDQLDAALDDLNASLRTLFDALLQNPVKNGNVITYTPDADALCAMATLLTEEQCLDVADHLTLVQTLTSETEGTLEFKFDGVTAATLGYSPTETWFEIDLAGFKSALLLILGILDPTSTPELPDTFQGKVRITTGTTPQGNATVKLSITEEIRIAGPVECGQMSIILGTTDKLFAMTADDQAGTATFEVGIAAVDVQVPFEDDVAACHTSTLSLGGLTATLGIDSNTQEFKLSNVGIGGTPLVFSVDSMEAIRLELATFGMTMDGTTGAVTTDTDFDMSLTLKNVQAIFEDFFESTDTTKEGSLSVTMPANTTIETADNGLGETVGIVTAGGPLAATGTDEMEGDISIGQGECFTLFPDLSLFPFAAGTCPD